MSRRRALALLLAVVALAAHGLATSSSCPTVCNCKWKGGKQTVECVNRGLITVPTNVHPETQVLDMSGNNLQILPRDLFVRAGLLNLQKVYLRRCRIGEIDDHAFRGLTNLVEMDLSNNLLTSVPSTTFSDIQFLREVVLANNPIQKIENNAFSNLPNLVKLDLSNCEIQSISSQAFESVDQLASLKLNGNRITELKQKTVDSLSRLHGIELHDNPWHCDCRLRATKLWLTHSNTPYTAAPRCHGGPARVAGRSVAELDLEDFACRPDIRSQRRVVETSAGDNATLECRVYATPAADVHWYWNGRQLANNSAFSTHQRVYVFEQGDFDKRHTLVLTNAQEADSSDFICVAENRAGAAEANFTLRVTLRAAGMSTLGSGQIAGLSAALVVLVLVILLVVLVLLVRLRRSPLSESKTPGRCVAAASAAAAAPAAHPNPAAPAAHAAHTKSASFSPGTNADAQGKAAHGAALDAALDAPDACNPVQKPPRLADVAGRPPHDAIDPTQGGAVPTHGARGPSNNPDLIKDTRRHPGEAAPAPAPAPAPVPTLPDGSAAASSALPGASWDSTRSSSLSTSPDVFIRRATSTNAVCFNYDASDKTPIIGDGTSLGGASEDETDCCLRGPLHAQLNGYPPDYGLPIPGAGAGAGAGTVAAAVPGASAPSSKTLRVWQRGVPVLPPVTALKRVLSSSRNSPDEGYQEGCGTDV